MVKFIVICVINFLFICIQQCLIYVCVFGSLVMEVKILYLDFLYSIWKVVIVNILWQVVVDLKI